MGVVAVGSGNGAIPEGSIATVVAAAGTTSEEEEEEEEDVDEVVDDDLRFFTGLGEKGMKDDKLLVAVVEVVVSDLSVLSEAAVFFLDTFFGES
jgi:hypothetical protein